MPHFLKTLLLWLLLALPPLQGMAALAQVACHPAGLQACAPATASTEHRHGGAETATSRHIDSMHRHALAQVPKKPAGAKHKHSGDGACASCCAGACAPPSALAFSPADREALAVLLSSPVFFTGFIPPGLERPPKRMTA